MSVVKAQDLPVYAIVRSKRDDHLYIRIVDRDATGFPWMELYFIQMPDYTYSEALDASGFDIVSLPKDDPVINMDRYMCSVPGHPEGRVSEDGVSFYCGGCETSFEVEETYRHD